MSKFSKLPKRLMKCRKPVFKVSHEFGTVPSDLDRVIFETYWNNGFLTMRTCERNGLTTVRGSW